MNVGRFITTWMPPLNPQTLSPYTSATWISLELFELSDTVSLSLQPWFSYLWPPPCHTSCVTCLLSCTGCVSFSEPGLFQSHLFNYVDLLFFGTTRGEHSGLVQLGVMGKGVELHRPSAKVELLEGFQSERRPEANVRAYIEAGIWDQKDRASTSKSGAVGRVGGKAGWLAGCRAGGGRGRG